MSTASVEAGDIGENAMMGGGKESLGGEEERAQGDQGRISVMHGLGEDSDDSDDSSDIEDLGAAHPPPSAPPFVTPNTILIHPAI